MAKKNHKKAKQVIKDRNAKYTTRNRALRRLQISLKDFRRLCILKGIFPRDPKNKAFGKDKTYYLTKDIKFLQHEPLLQKFRDLKVFMKKFKKAKIRGEFTKAKHLIKDLKPDMSLDHLIKERYPTFRDALRDMDDCVSMIHLYAVLPGNAKNIPVERTLRCARLVSEFQNYVIRTNSLRKVFLSIKGIYYQAEIMGQHITWVVPYRFTQELPHDIDYRIMNTFLDFYETLMEFVNYKLYHSLNLKYPPDLVKSAQDGMTLDVFQFHKEKQEQTDANKQQEKQQQKTEDKNEPAKQQAKTSKKDKEKLSKLIKSMGKIAEKDLQMQEENKGEAAEGKEDKDLGATQADGDAMDTGAEGEAVFAESEERKAILLREQEKSAYQTLFKGLKMFLSRETPIGSLEFVIRSFGGSVYTDNEENPKYTHHIIDRNVIKNKLDSREYVQPQWVYDCVNARVLLPVQQYAIGAELPPHLSPFVDNVNDQNTYVPERAKYIQSLQKRAQEDDVNKGEDQEEDKADGDSDSEIEDEQHAAELHRERKGVNYSKAADAAEKQKNELAQRKLKKKRAREEKEKEEEIERRKNMLPNSKRKFVNVVMNQQNHEKQKKLGLERKAERAKRQRAEKPNQQANKEATGDKKQPKTKKRKTE